MTSSRTHRAARAELPRWARSDLFSWCEEMEIDSPDLASAILHVSLPTLANWKRDPDGEVPSRVVACAFGYEAWRGAGLGERVNFAEPTRSWFDSWLARNGIDGYGRFAKELGYPRQRAGDWFRHGRHPEWLVQACLGLEALRLDLIPGNSRTARIVLAKV